MSHLLKGFIAILTLVTLYFGIYFTTNYDSDNASFFNLPEFVSVSSTTDAGNAEESDRLDNLVSGNIAERAAADTQSSSDNPARRNILQEFNDAIVDITELTNPTVVTITTHQTVRQRQRTPFSLFFDDPNLDREREYQRQGLGSGVIVSEEGYILTNNHVIENADEIVVQTYDGDELDAEVVGTDPDSDIAVLRVNSPNLSAIALGDSDALRAGEMVLAIGSPLAQQFAHSVSMGVVSATGRAQLGLSPYENYIQTDAAINPGNSGGALINMQGQLVGINTAIASRTGGHQGVGFAIPVNMASSVMESIIEDGRVVRSYVGIYPGGMVDRTMARALGLDVNYGAVIGGITPDSPAERAGLAEGDVLLSRNGQPIRDWSQFRVEIANSDPGTEVEFEIFRDGERQTVTIELEEMPEDETLATVPDEQREELREDLGFSVTNLTDNARRQLDLPSEIQGVIVRDIQQGSRAYRQGLRGNDIIFQIQNQPVRGEDEFYNAVTALKEADQDVMLLRVLRNGNRSAYIAIEI